MISLKGPPLEITLPNLQLSLSFFHAIGHHCETLFYFFQLSMHFGIVRHLLFFVGLYLLLEGFESGESCLV